MQFNILDYGAGTHLDAKSNQKAIQAAIDAVYHLGGGTVLIPSGTFVTGTLRLKSNVTLYLSAGSLLMGSTDFEDYFFSDAPWPWVSMAGIPDTGENAGTSGLIMAIDAQNVSIEGHGTIDGNGQGHLHFPNPADPHQRRPMLLYFDRCCNIHITDVTLKNPAMFTVWSARSRQICVRGIRIYSMETENGDGLDFNGSSDVTISDCFLATGDDAISLKTPYRGVPCRNYVITNCIIRSIWAAFRMGPESSADMSDIVLSNCVFESCNDGIKIQDCSEGMYENIRMDNVVMRDVHRPVFITISSFRLSKDDTSIRPHLGGIRNISISNVTAQMSAYSAEYQRNCFVLSGSLDRPIQNVRFSNCRFEFAGAMQEGALNRVDVPEFLDYTFMYGDVFSINGDYPASGLFMRHVDQLELLDCQLLRCDADPRPLIFAYEVKDALLRNVCARGQGTLLQSARAQIRLNACRHNGNAFDAPDGMDGALLERFESFMRLSREVDTYFAATARQVDRAEACAHMETICDSRWTREGSIWKTSLKFNDPFVMLQLVSYGEVELWVNGSLAASSRIPALYRNMHSWAADISAWIHEGENEIQLRWLDPKDVGGIRCALPFGAFSPLCAGLLRPVRIYSDPKGGISP